ncbi:Hypothetical protein, putative [Bodo saltans]|uniref:Uncharacterized protein n=1 Tax=Bodo saltans TaxID=75058 RepID=A0A0S4JF15_BODSA|nr:Hypothetical protein, putative [Bodo saltans]|eukprot:CUG88638.1 Hypothetical protein, putative [Bodo saltans]
MTEMTGVPIIPKCFSLLGPTSSPSSSGLLLSRQRILEAQYLAQTIAGLSSEGSLLTPLGRSILEQTFRSSRDAQPSSKTNSLDHSSDTTTAEQTFSSKVEGVMSRLEELTNEILNSFKGVLEAWIAHSDRNGCPLLHYHLQYENAPTSPGSIPQSTSSAVVCVVTVRLASAVKEYSEAQLAIEREVSSRYYCRQPLSWTSAQAAAFYFPPSAEADNDDDDDDDNGGIADSGRTEFFAMLKNKIVHRSEDMSVIRKKRVRSPEASDGSLSGGVVLGSLRTSCSEPMQCSSR